MEVSGRTRMTAVRLMIMVALVECGGVAATADSGGPLLPCGTHRDFLPDGQQLMGHFQFAKDVCCSQLGENCEGHNPLPQSCLSPTCARAVRLVSDSCSELLKQPYFQVMAMAYKPLLDQAMGLCDAATTAREDAGTTELRHVISDHVDGLAAQNGGGLTDGMGTGGHNVSITGQDWVVLHAATGQMVQLDLLALWLSKGNNLRVYIDDDAEGTMLQGTVLPPAESGGRRFRSKPGGKIRVLLVTDDLASLSFFTLEVRATCVDSSGCGGHGSCSNGNCTCSGGFHEMGCQCATGYKSGKSACVEDKCYDKVKHVRITCGGRGTCNETTGVCLCQSSWGGAGCAACTKSCSNHGTCDASGTCKCQGGWEGPSCGVFNRFPRSRIVTDPAWGDEVNGWAGKGQTQMWELCFSSFTDDSSNATTFHRQCDKYNTTMTFVRNSLGYTFGGYAVVGWSKEACCATAGPYCQPGDTYCVNHVSDADFLFRLSPGAPSKYGALFMVGQDPPPQCVRGRTGRPVCTTDPSAHNYQFSDGGVFQAWGNHHIGQNNYRDLYLGGTPLGHGGYCNQGGTYHSGEICGNGAWGQTSMEVYRLV